MKRYQIYLNPSNVSILDEFEKYTHISRSKLIRAVIDRLAEQFAKVFVAKKTPLQKKYVLDKLIGFIKLKNKEKTNYAQTIDKVIYSKGNL